MIYDDDERILEQTNGTEEIAHIELADGSTEAKIINKKMVPMVESQFKVLLELKGVGSGEERLSVDLVIVLDTSYSMLGTKIAKMKLAMQFLLKKLGPYDRLSVVTFNKRADRLCPLRQITKKSQTEIADKVNILEAKHSTNTEDGLKMALKILDGRTHKEGRRVAIMLMSDGKENKGSDSANVPVGEVPVYTFGFGQDYDEKVLSAVAKNGGTFTPVPGLEDLTVALATSLAGLLQVAIVDLTLTIIPKNGSQFTEVNAGNYKQTKGSKVDPVTITFPSLYDEETRNVLVILTLPEVKERKGNDVLEMVYKYRVGNEKDAFKSERRSINVTRTDKSIEAEKEEVVAEEKRIRTASRMKEARLLADAKKLEQAREKLKDAKTSLSEVDTILKAQLDKLFEFMASEETYDKQGRAFALALEASHDSQRGGTVSLADMYNTRLMNLYKQQAQLFDINPTNPIGPDPIKPKPKPKPEPEPQNDIVLKMLNMVVDFNKNLATKIKDNPLSRKFTG